LKEYNHAFNSTTDIRKDSNSRDHHQSPTYDELVDDKHTPHTSSRGGTKGIQEQQLLSEQVCAADVDKDEKKALQ
jgi:hypothetical protein